MTEKIKNIQNQYIAGSGMIIGGGIGYLRAAHKVKHLQKSTQAVIEKLDTEAKNKILDVNKNILQDCRKNPEYLLKIDAFEKEGKLLDKDFYLEDILEEEEKAAYKLAKKDFLEKSESKKKSVLKNLHKVSIKLRRNHILIGLIAGISAGIAAVFAKDKIKTKNILQK